MSSEVIDLLIVGAGPTGINIAYEGQQAGLSVLMVDRGPLTAAILKFPEFMTFFTTRDKLEIAKIPMSIPDEKPTRQQALAYYRGVVERYQIPMALHEDVERAEKQDNGTFIIHTTKDGKAKQRLAKNVVLATGYFDQPFKLDLPGSKLPWVQTYYQEPYRHYGEHVLLIGGGNSAAEAALDLWRNGAQVTMVVRDSELKTGIKYWVRPDVENRIEEGSIRAYFNTVVTAFHDDPRCVEIMIADRMGEAHRMLEIDACYALIGFKPDDELERRCGIEIDAQTLVPKFNAETCESNVPGLYVAGTLQSGLDTGKIFIENSREHAPLIINNILAKRDQG